METTVVEIIQNAVVGFQAVLFTVVVILGIVLACRKFKDIEIKL